MRRKTAQERQLWWLRADWKELPHVQGKEQWLHFAGAAVKRYPTSEIREAQVSYDQPRHHIKKQRHYFVNKGPSSQGYSFSSGYVWCESWTIKKAERQRIDAFELWCCRRLLRVLWTARRSNQSILKEISPGCSLEGLDWCWSWNSNTWATWCKKLTHLERPWCWERLREGGEGDDGGWDGWMASPTQWT